jgi:hypothetical protein
MYPLQGLQIKAIHMLSHVTIMLFPTHAKACLLGLVHPLFIHLWWCFFLTFVQVCTFAGTILWSQRADASPYLSCLPGLHTCWVMFIWPNMPLKATIAGCVSPILYMLNHVPKPEVLVLGLIYSLSMHPCWCLHAGGMIIHMLHACWSYTSTSSTSVSAGPPCH